MYQLAPDEKSTRVMLYARNELVHGELVTKQGVRVSILPRMQALTNLLHLVNTQVLLFGGGQPVMLKHQELFFPAERMIGLHIAPPECDPPDFEEGLANRGVSEIQVTLGLFAVKGKMRVSTAVSPAANLELAYKSWLSVYDADITCPFLPQMPAVHVPMLIVNPSQASFGT